MQTLIYPTNLELTAILQDLLPTLTMDDPILSSTGLFPPDTTDRAKIQWEQLDNFVGLSSLRGIDGLPGRVNMVGLKTYEVAPGYYGDVSHISEQDMTTWRKPGDPTAPWDLTELVMMRQQQLLNIAINRIRQVCWTLAATGTFSVASPNGLLVHTDSFAIQTYSTTHPWTAYTTAEPLKDFRAVQLKHRGHSVKFDSSAQAFMNRKTSNDLLFNENAADLYGRRVTGLATVNSLPQLKQLMGVDDLPEPIVYDEGYLDANDTFQPFIPDGKVIVIGRRPGNARLGNAMFTRNASQISSGRKSDADISNPWEGLVMKVVDHGETMAVGRTIDEGLGFNWGPTLEYPSAIVAMDVTAGS